MMTLHWKISNATQIINTLSYTCTDANHLQTMLDKLEKITRVFKAGLATIKWRAYSSTTVSLEENKEDQKKI